MSSPPTDPLDPTGPVPSAPRGLNREILRLAVPALGALLAEPLFLLADSAIIGHLGTAQLAGLGLAAVILNTVVGLSVFLAYGTTSQVARQIGAGNIAGALGHGLDGMWFAVIIGTVLAAIGWPASSLLIEWTGGSGPVAEYGTTYLQWSTLGLPAMLLVLASTGVLRGLQDTRTPLVAAVAGAVLNVGLNLLLVYGFGAGVAGSAIGTVITQWLMAAALVLVAVRACRLHEVPLRPHLGRLGGVGRVGFPLFLRTLTLRATAVGTTVIAAGQGVTALAAHQVVFNIWNLLALGLDALAIAAQALTGKALGAGDAAGVRLLSRRLLIWGVWAGVAFGLLVLAVHGVAGSAFTTDPAVRAAIAATMIVLAVGQPLSGWVFVLDGLLIGAGDGVFLAKAGVVNLLAYLPAAAAVVIWAPGGTAGLVWLWVAFIGVYMSARAVTLGVRYRGNAWLVTGS